jgi:hypothetical protein
VTLAAKAVIAVAVATGFCLQSLILHTAAAQEETHSVVGDEFAFDVEEFEKSPWSLNGYLQGDLAYMRLDRDAAFYRIAFLGVDEKVERLQGGGEIQAGLAFQAGSVTAYALGTLQQNYDGEQWDATALLYEGSLSWQVGSNAYFTLGKALLRWGKGYAWNPTNFAGRSKNPSDPDLSLEGYWLGLADIVKSFSGPLKTIALTTVILPTSDDINSDFGKNDHTNVAGKLYLLLYDTDIDVMALLKGTRTARYGLTVSRNMSTNFEVHAEVAHVADFRKVIVRTDGSVTSDEYDAWSSLAGMRYLAPTNTTLILEYYHNGEGYTEEEASDFFHFIGVADNSQLTTVLSHLSGYQRPNFMRNYLYLKGSQKEPFGWLYVTPSLFTILNLDDGSLNVIPEMSYAGIENLELRCRFNVSSGCTDTEFGDKVSDWKIEFRARYFF